MTTCGILISHARSNFSELTTLLTNFKTFGPHHLSRRLASRELPSRQRRISHALIQTLGERDTGRSASIGSRALYARRLPTCLQ